MFCRFLVWLNVVAVAGDLGFAASYGVGTPEYLFFVGLSIWNLGAALACLHVEPRAKDLPSWGPP